MVDQLIRAQFDYSNTAGATPTRPILQGGFAVQQADGKLLSRKPDGSTRVTDIREMVDQLATGPLATAFGLKADLINGLVPIAQLPPVSSAIVASGDLTTLTTQQQAKIFEGVTVITSPDGTRYVYKGSGSKTLAASYTIVGSGVVDYSQIQNTPVLKQGAFRDVGVAVGTIMDGADARVLKAVPVANATSISASPTPVWAQHTAIFDREFVGVGLAATPTVGAPGGGYADKQAWPGGGLYGATSAITGYVRVPPEAEASFANGNPTNFFHAGLMGLTLNDTNNQATVGVFGMARAGKTQGRPFGANFVIANVRDSSGIYDANNVRIPGVHFQGVGIEVDCTWSQPAGNPTGGSNLLGIWIPAECYGGRPDGDCAAIKTGLYSDKPGDSCWKQFLLADHGAADLFAQIGMKKNKLVDGASESQGFFLISARSGQYNVNPQTGAFISDTHQYKFSKIFQSPDGDIVFKPNSGFGSIIVGNENDTQKSSISPTAIASSSGTFGSLSVPNNATISGIMTSGSVATGAINSSSFNTTGNGGFGGNVTAGGNVASATFSTGDATINGTLYYKNQPVQLSASGGTIPPGFKALMIAG